MISAWDMGIGLYDNHCKKSKVLTHTGKGDNICGICEKELIFGRHWYGGKWVLKENSVTLMENSK